MKKKSIKKNYLYNLSYQILVMLLPFITTPYVSRILGVTNIGIYSYTLSISTFFILFGSLGVALYGQREIAFVQEDKKKYSKIFWEILLLRCISMFISIVIFWFTFANGNNDYKIYYRILLVELLANVVDISWFFQGLEEFKKTVIRNTLVKILSLIAIFTLVKDENDLVKYFLIYVLSNFLGNFSLWFYLPRYLTNCNFRELQPFKHLKPTLFLFIPQIAIQVYTLLDKTMIGAIISDKAEVGYYEQAQKIVKTALTIITSLGTVMMPRIANTYSKGEKKKVKSYMKKSFNLVFLLAFPIIFGLISVSDDFVPVFFGDGYERTAEIIKIISPIILLIGLSNVTGTQYLLPTKRQNQYTISVVCGSIVNFIMNLILIRKLGAIGASIGTVIAEFTVTSIQIYFTRDDFELKEVLKLSKNYAFSAIIMFMVCLILRHMINSNFISVVVQVIVGAMTYGVILLLMRDKFVKEFINKILKRSK